MIQLPNIEEVKQTNMVTIVKQLIGAVQYLSDKQGERDTELYQILRDNQRQTNMRLDILTNNIEDDQKQTNIRLDNLTENQKQTNIRLDNLTENQKQTNIRLDNLTEKMKEEIGGLRGEMKEQTELLRIIANNVKR